MVTQKQFMVISIMERGFLFFFVFCFFIALYRNQQFAFGAIVSSEATFESSLGVVASSRNL
jgi:hypothetical protein